MLFVIEIELIVEVKEGVFVYVLIKDIIFVIVIFWNK